MSDKAERVALFHKHSVEALAEMLAAAGISHPDELQPHHVVQRVDSNRVRRLDQLHHFLEPAALLGAGCDIPYYAENWERARADSFGPVVDKSLHHRKGGFRRRSVEMIREDQQR